MVLLLTRNDIESIMDMKFCLRAVEDAFRQLGQGNVSMPPRVSIPISTHQGYCFLMPAYIHGEREALAIKIVTQYNNNPTMHHLPTVQASVLLYSPVTGALVAIMDGVLFTAMRTGAASGVATNYLARKDSKTLGVIGTGFQARTQTMAILEVRKIERIRAYDIYPENCQKFCEDIGTKFKVECICSRDANDVVVGSDIIVTATTSETPVFDGKLLEEGTHVNSIAGLGQELDEYTIKNSKLVVDSRQAALEEARDIIIPIKKGVISPGHVYAELSELVLGKKRGRTNAEEITVFKSVGLAVEDAATARELYDLAKERRVGTDIPL